MNDARRLRRDRRGRGLRGPLLDPVHPAARRRELVFERSYAGQLRALRRRHPELEAVRFGLQRVPAFPAGEDLPLGRVLPASEATPAHIVLFRRPIETRAQDSRELPDIIGEVLRQQVALLLGIDEDEV